MNVLKDEVYTKIAQNHIQVLEKYLKFNSFEVVKDRCIGLP